MKHAFTTSSLALLAAIVSSACDSPSAPVEQPPAPASEYDLIYSSSTGSILVQSLEGGQPIPFGFGTNIAFDPVATPDGRNVVFARLSDIGGTQITSVDRVTGIKTDLTDGEEIDYQPAFSPDGSRVVFVSERNVGSNLFVMNRDGSNVKALTVDPLPEVTVDRSPAWSPDGRYIAWSSSVGGFLAIWIMNADGTGVHRLTHSTDAFEDDPAWSPDGTQVAYFEITGTTPRLVVVDANGGNRRVLPTPPNGQSRDATWSPDGKLIAFSYIPDDRSRPQIYTMKPDGTDLRQRLHDDQNRGVRRATFIRH